MPVEHNCQEITLHPCHWDIFSASRVKNKRKTVTCNFVVRTLILIFRGYGVQGIWYICMEAWVLVNRGGGGITHSSVALILIKNFPFHFFPSHLSILFLTDFVNYSIETTIVMGQNMQMWHSLRCKQIHMFTANQLILTFPSNAGMPLFNFSSREFQSILPTTVHACVTKSKLVAKPRGVTLNTECEESLKSSERYASYC